MSTTVEFRLEHRSDRQKSRRQRRRPIRLFTMEARLAADQRVSNSHTVSARMRVSAEAIRNKITWEIGRSPTAFLCLPHVNVSRRHAAICYDGEKETWSIKDHKSTNGVIVDGNAIQPLKETALSDGQTVQLGPDSDFAWTFRLVRLRNKTKKHELPEEEEPSGPRAKRPRLSSPSLDSNKAVIEKLRTKFNEELSCTICNEVFIQPTSLPCGHVFCKYCLSRWKKQCSSRQYDCPNCRQRVGREKVTPNLYLENLISSWMGELGPDMLAERTKAIEDRKKQEIEDEKLEALKKLEAQKKKKKSQRGRRGRGIESYLQLPPPRRSDESAEADGTSGDRIATSTSPANNALSSDSDSADGEDVPVSRAEALPGSFYQGYGASNVVMVDTGNLSDCT